MKLKAKSFNGIRGLAVAIAIAALALAGTYTSRVVSHSGDCAQKREWCIDSCYKQRQNCDKNNTEEYCVNQDKQCQKGCEDAFRRCSEQP
jgi:hypothetical protein